MKRYTFADGSSITSNLSAEELIRRINRLDKLRVLTENFTDGEGQSIARKAYRAENKTDNFTGIIRLSFDEKEFLGYLLDNEYLEHDEVDAIKFYMRF